MSTQPVDMFGTTESVPSVSFADAPIGASVTGKVTEAPVLLQSRNYKTHEPDFWPDGNPKMSVVTKLVTTNGEERGLWAAKPSAMFAAIAEAQKTAGALIAVGGTLTITYTGTKPAAGANLSPQKLYTVSYTPPDAFEAQQPAQQASGGWSTPQAEPPPAWSQPASAPAAPQWTPEQVAAAKAAGILLPGI